MNEIFGLIPFHGHPIHPQFRDTMARVWCRNGCQQTWVEEAATLGQVACGPWRPAAPLIFRSAAEGIVLATGARLDNRGELLWKFGLSGPEQETTPDDALVLAACRRWGEDAPRHLLGDWHFALWNRARRSLLLARDPWGHTSLYYHADLARLAFATDIRAILAFPDVPRRPDLQVAAARLMSWPGDGVATFHEGVKQLPAGHLLRLSEGRLEIRRYWDPRNLAPLRLARDEDYVEAFVDHYERAVRIRLPDDVPVAATLSAGLDSGSVVALAGPALGEKGRELLAFTSVPSLAAAGAGSDRIGDEWRLAAETARMAETRGGRIQHLAVSCGGASLLDSIERNFEIHLDPGHAVSNYHWIQEIMEQCRLRGIRVLLTGQSGNGSISWTGTGSLFFPLLRGDFHGVLRALGAEANPWLALKRQFIGPLLAPFRRARVRLTTSREPWREYSAISSGFVQECGILERMRAAGHDPTFVLGPTEDGRMRMFAPQMGRVGTLWKEAGIHYELDVRDPTRDVRLVEFCLRVPDEQYLRKGQCRWLLRRAMKGRMPACVLDNPRKGLQSADLGHRVLRERTAILGALDRLEASEQVRHILDLRRMRDVMQSLEQGVTPANTATCGSILLRGLSVGLALLRF